MRWISGHCDIKGNEEADRLSKEGSMATQKDHPISYSEAKALLRNCFYSSWRARLGPRERDELDHLTRKQQIVIFRLRTGHCRLLAHLNRIRISHTNECPYGTESQATEHVLQSCPLHDQLRQAFLPDGEDLQEKLWGTAESLKKSQQCYTTQRTKSVASFFLTKYTLIFEREKNVNKKSWVF